MQKDSNLYDKLRTILLWRRFIFRNVIIVTLLAAIISLIIPYKYTSTATILPPSADQGSMLGLLSMGMPSDLAGLSRFAGGLPGLTSASDLYAAIMQSSRIKGAIIKEYNLKKEFKAKTMHDASKALDEITNISISMEGIISVSITYKNKYLAADIANSYVDELDKFNTETAMTAGKKYRIFMEERLNENIDSLQEAENALMVFQEKHHTVALEAEIEGAIAAIANLKSEMILLEVQKAAIGSGNPNNPHVRKINQQLQELRKQLARIEFGDTTVSQKGFGAGFAVPFSELPKVVIEYARLVRDVEVQSAIFEILTQQYEQAKIMELKDTPTIQILDRASPPEKRSWPKRTLIVVFAFILSLFASVLLVFLLNYFSDVKTHPDNHANMMHFQKAFSEDIKYLQGIFNKHVRRKT